MSKIAAWRAKTEREKHVIALTGAVIVTIIVALAAFVGLFSKINQPIQNKAEAKAKPLSPFSLVVGTFGNAIGKVGDIKSSLANVLSTAEKE